MNVAGARVLQDLDEFAEEGRHEAQQRHDNIRRMVSLSFLYVF